MKPLKPQNEFDSKGFRKERKNPLKSPEELSKLIKETGRGRNLIFYEFDISKSPVLCADRNGVLKSCTCLAHSIYANKTLRETKCRFLLAYDLYKKRHTAIF